MTAEQIDAIRRHIVADGGECSIQGECGACLENQRALLSEVERLRGESKCCVASGDVSAGSEGVTAEEVECLRHGVRE
jgi:hypothetical protein